MESQRVQRWVHTINFSPIPRNVPCFSPVLISRMPKSRDPWFTAREGGASYYPVTWQGYVVLIGYVVLLSLASLAIFKSWALFFALVIALSVVLAIIVSATSSEF